MNLYKEKNGGEDSHRFAPTENYSCTLPVSLTSHWDTHFKEKLSRTKGHRMERTATLDAVIKKDFIAEVTFE